MGEEGKNAEDRKAQGEGKKEESKKDEAGGEKKAEGSGGGEKKGDEGGKKEGDGGEQKAEGGGGEKEGEQKETPPPQPPLPEEIILRVYMHCEGCARKVRRSLKGFEGVDEVLTDCRTHKVVVKGKVAAADPLKVADRVQKKCGRKVELLTPIPPKPEKKQKEEEKEKPKREEKEEPPVMSVVLKVHMHCEACSQEIKKRILKMKGVQSAEPDLKKSEVSVTGVMDPPKLVEYVYKRTGKHAAIVKAEPVEKKPDDKPKEDGKDEKKAEGDKDGEDAGGAGGKGEKEEESGGGGGGEEAAAGAKGDKEGGGGAAPPPEDPAAVTAAMALATAKMGEVTRNPYYFYHPRYQVEYYAYPPQIFSDENPNACSVM